MWLVTGATDYSDALLDHSFFTLQYNAAPPPVQPSENHLIYKHLSGSQLKNEQGEELPHKCHAYSSEHILQACWTSSVVNQINISAWSETVRGSSPHCFQVAPSSNKPVAYSFLQEVYKNVTS